MMHQGLCTHLGLTTARRLQTCHGIWWLGAQRQGWVTCNGFWPFFSAAVCQYLGTEAFNEYTVKL